MSDGNYKILRQMMRGALIGCVATLADSFTGHVVGAYLGRCLGALYEAVRVFH